MATGRDEWEDDGDALYGEGRSEDLRPPRRPGGQPAQGQDRMGGGQTPPRDDYRSARREPSFGSQGSAPQGQYIGGSQMAGSAMSSPPGNAGNNPRQADDWDEVDPYENLTDRGGPTAPPRRGGKKRRRLLPILLALLFLCAFGAIAWYGYNWGLSGGDDGPIPLVTAERSDIKDEPEDGQEGGTQALRNLHRFLPRQKFHPRLP